MDAPLGRFVKAKMPLIIGAPVEKAIKISLWEKEKSHAKVAKLGVIIIYKGN